ncbi:hypothetical protein [Methylorubrum extorquens]|uniref:hypothetical protein n=1 Tax=Methylorubrum extorquens TaxID=408 RepID=UPI0011BD45CC|nr:hypothetical protein [Methylorubrum extorquens]
MGAGLRSGEAIVVIADCDEAVMVSIADGVGAATIAMPAYAARRLGEQLMRKAAEVKRASELDGLGILVPRRPDPNTACPPMG